MFDKPLTGLRKLSIFLVTVWYIKIVTYYLLWFIGIGSTSLLYKPIMGQTEWTTLNLRGANATFKIQSSQVGNLWQLKNTKNI